MKIIQHLPSAAVTATVLKDTQSAIEELDIQALESFDSDALLEHIIEDTLDHLEETISVASEEALFEWLLFHDQLRSLMEEKEQLFIEAVKEQNAMEQNPLKYHGLKQGDFL